MSSSKSGGPAFPVKTPTPGYNFETVHEGMTLRDYFAAKATDVDVEAALAVHEYLHNTADRTAARYRHADAMLKAREQDV